jgi:hypothetical protein
MSNRREALTRRAVGEASDVGLDIDEPIRIYPVTDGKTDHALGQNPIGGWPLRAISGHRA